MNQLKNLYHFFLAWLGAAIYRHPSWHLTVVGITGTKGKSTAVEILHTLLEAGGRKTAMLSSVYVKIGNERTRNPTETTMPGRFFIQRFLRRAVDAGCTHAVIEVTSQGVAQHRHRSIEWDGGVFLNIHPEHIEAHGSYEAYREAKLSFFRYVARGRNHTRSWVVVNTADASVRMVEGAVGRGVELIRASRERFVKEVLHGKRGALGDWFDNDFNMEDAALASAAATHMGVPLPTSLGALKKFKGLPGRMEWVQREPFGVVIDYAHTPDSLRAAYRALHEKLSSTFSPHPSHVSSPGLTRGSNSKVLDSRLRGNDHRVHSKLICILGSAGGGRDKWKRPALGKIAGEYCDHIILTDEDPYEEDPRAILEDIAKGIEENFMSTSYTQGSSRYTRTVYPSSLSRSTISRYEIVVDRKEAIAKAVRMAKPGDIVVMTDKGSEEWIHLKGGRKIQWSEREAAEEALKNRGIDLTQTLDPKPYTLYTSGDAQTHFPRGRKNGNRCKLSPSVDRGRRTGDGKHIDRLRSASRFKFL